MVVVLLGVLENVLIVMKENLHKEMIGDKWLPNSQKFKCKVCNKFHLIDIHNNGKQSISVTGRDQ